MNVKKRLKMSLDMLIKQIKRIRHMRGLVGHSRTGRLLKLHFYYAWICRHKTAGFVGAANEKQVTSELRGIANSVVSDIVKSWSDPQTSTGEIQDENVLLPRRRRPGNKNERPWRVNNTSIIYSKIRDFVRSKRQKRERGTGVDILNYLVAANIIEIHCKKNGTIDKTDRLNATRAVQSYLLHKEFRRRERTGCIRNNSNHTALCNE